MEPDQELQQEITALIDLNTTEEPEDELQTDPAEPASDNTPDGDPAEATSGDGASEGGETDEAEEAEEEEKTNADAAEELEVDDLECIRQELDAVLATKIPVAQPTPPSPSAKEVDFLTELGIDKDEAIDTGVLNQLLNKVYTKAREELYQTKEELQTRQTQQAEMQAIHQQFYAANQDLSKYKNLVGKVSQDVLNSLSEKDKADLSVQEYFSRVADEARKVLKLTISQAAPSKEAGKPSFPKLKGARTGKTAKEKVPEIVQEIDTLLQYAEQF